LIYSFFVTLASGLHVDAAPRSAPSLLLCPFIDDVNDAVIRPTEYQSRSRRFKRLT
jgi:hypothetical protein